MHNDVPELKHAVVAVDTALFTLHDNHLYVRVIETDRPPYVSHMPALPGGLLGIQEGTRESSLRHIEQKTGITASHVYTEQLATFSDPKRDPRGRVVSVAYLALVPWENLKQEEQEETSNSWWVPVLSAPHLAFDHDEILRAAILRLSSRITYTTLIQKLMPKEFTLTELEKAYEVIAGKDLDKRNFRKKILKLGILKELNKKRTGDRARPAELYAFKTPRTGEIQQLDIL